MAPNQSPIQFNLKANEPTLIDVLKQFSRNMLLDLSCHHVGTIKGFDESNQTATATINYPKTFSEYDTKTQQYVARTMPYPILVDCPVIVLGGGPCSLTFPIVPGDECVVLFNDRAIDNWFAGGSGAALSSSRAHSFSDGLILVGIRSAAKSLADYDTTRAVLQNGETMVGVGASLIRIANETTTLNTLLQNLINAIKALTTTNAVPGSPCAISAASQAALAVIATQIGGLLE